MLPKSVLCKEALQAIISVFSFLPMAKALVALHGANEGIRLVGEGIANLTTVVQNGGKLITATEEVGSIVVSAVDKALAVLQEVKNKEIKHSYQLKTTIWHDILSLTEKVSALFVKINNLLFYCRNRTMATARKELVQTSPNLQPLRDLICHLKEMSKQAQDKQSELWDACDTVVNDCKEPAEDCAQLEEESRKKKKATRAIGGSLAAGSALAGVTAVSGAVAAGSIFLGVVFGPVTFGLSTVVGLGVAGVGAGAVAVTGTALAVGGGIATHKIAEDFKESEVSFKNLCAAFDSLLQSLRAVEGGVVVFQTSLEDIATQVDNIEHSTEQQNIDLIEDSLESLSVACSSCDTVLRHRDQVQKKAHELKATIDKILTNPTPNP